MSLGWLRYIPLQLELAAVAQMLKLHLSYVKVSVVVAGWTDDYILLALNVAEEPCF